MTATVLRFPSEKVQPAAVSTEPALIIIIPFDRLKYDRIIDQSLQMWMKMWFGGLL